MTGRSRSGQAPERARQTVRQFHDALVDGGWLIASPSEASHALFSQFTMASLAEAILYKKDTGAGRPEAYGFKAMEAANKYAALSTTRPGTQKSFVDRATFETARD